MVSTHWHLRGVHITSIYGTTCAKGSTTEVNPQPQHLIFRCTRRMFLCSRQFEHLKDWIRDRLFVLSQHFSVGIAAYAVMSNHLHIVAIPRPKGVQTWSDQQVVHSKPMHFSIANRKITAETRRASQRNSSIPQPEDKSQPPPAKSDENRAPKYDCLVFSAVRPVVDLRATLKTRL